MKSTKVIFCQGGSGISVCDRSIKWYTSVWHSQRSWKVFTEIGTLLYKVLTHQHHLWQSWHRINNYFCFTTHFILTSWHRIKTLLKNHENNKLVENTNHINVIWWLSEKWRHLCYIIEGVSCRAIILSKPKFILDLVLQAISHNNIVLIISIK